MTDLFGLSIDGLDLPRFLALSRLLFVGTALAAAALAALGSSARRSGRIVLALALVGHTIAWFATMHPLANPYGTILSAAMMLRQSLHAPEAADVLEAAVHRAISDRMLTRDLGGTATTAHATTAVVERLRVTDAVAA